MKFAENKRNSNFELLRIFMMFFIILNHLFVHGFSKYAGLSDLEWFFVNSFKWLGMIGNYAFMLLTGYFSVVLIFCTCSLIDIFVSVVLEKLILKRK